MHMVRALLVGNEKNGFTTRFRLGVFCLYLFSLFFTFRLSLGVFSYDYIVCCTPAKVVQLFFMNFWKLKWSLHS